MRFPKLLQDVETQRRSLFSALVVMGLMIIVIWSTIKDRLDIEWLIVL